jgi:predicted GIY-YIG superfamily endonuclease
VYTLYGEDNKVLYVGCTRRPEVRWREHCSGGNRRMVSQVVRKKMSGPYDYLTARRIEREQQIALRPTYGRIPRNTPAPTEDVA